MYVMYSRNREQHTGVLEQLTFSQEHVTPLFAAVDPRHIGVELVDRVTERATDWAPAPPLGAFGGRPQCVCRRCDNVKHNERALKIETMQEAAIAMA